MKKFVLNNKGSTLMVVLLITIIFSVLFLSFTGISINANKHNKKVENTSQSVALAEMGVEYYSTAINNELNNSIKNLIESEFQRELSKYKAEELTTNIIEEAKYKSIKIAYRELQNVINNDIKFAKFKEKISGNTDLSLEIKSVKFSPEVADGLNRLKPKGIITFESYGISKGNSESKINATLSIDFEEIQTNFNQTTSFTEPPDELFTDKCASDSLNFAGKKCKIPGAVIGNNNNKKITFNNSQIKVDGDFILPNLNQNNFGNSKIYINGDLGTSNNKYQANLNGAENYTLFISGKAYIQNTNNSKGATICVNELMAYQGGDANVYAKKIGNSKDVKGNVNITPADFEANCKWQANGSPTTIWDNPLVEREFSY